MRTVFFQGCENSHTGTEHWSGLLQGEIHGNFGNEPSIHCDFLKYEISLIARSDLMFVAKSWKTLASDLPPYENLPLSFATRPCLRIPHDVLVGPRMQLFSYTVFKFPHDCNMCLKIKSTLDQFIRKIYYGRARSDEWNFLTLKNLVCCENHDSNQAKFPNVTL